MYCKFGGPYTGFDLDEGSETYSKSISWQSLAWKKDAVECERQAVNEHAKKAIARLTCHNTRLRCQDSFGEYAGVFDVAEGSSYFGTLNRICRLTTRDFEEEPAVSNCHIRWIELMVELCLWK